MNNQKIEKEYNQEVFLVKQPEINLLPEVEIIGINELTEIPTEYIENQEQLDEFLDKNKDIVEHLENDKELNEKKRAIINRRLFIRNGKIRTNQAKHLTKYSNAYCSLGKFFLNRAWSNHNWEIAYDEELKSLFVMNVLSPLNIPIFKLKGISDLDDFIRLILASGKKIMVESNLERDISQEEYAELIENTNKIIMDYNKFKETK